MNLAERMAETIDRTRGDRRVLVAFDGPDAAGKTTLAEATAQRLRRPVLRTSIDRWHKPREVRLRRGPESPEGYYLDSFDLTALVADCLLPFRGGASRVRTAAFDYRADESVQREEHAAPDAALLVDGVFLLRSELRELWDLTVYLHVPESVTMERALTRDLDLLGGEEEVRRRYTQRYLPGQRRYRDAARPQERADILIDNTDPNRPAVLRWRDG